ncbi:hypothetical protein ACN28S_22075 [Cystobacter fuscus]
MGDGGGDDPGASSEVFDPATGTWSPAGQERDVAAAVVLRSGKVLVLLEGRGAELYDPTTGSWSPSGPMVRPRYRASMVLLPSGEALVLGGDNDRPWRSCTIRRRTPGALRPRRR